MQNKRFIAWLGLFFLAAAMPIGVFAADSLFHLKSGIVFSVQNVSGQPVTFMHHLMDRLPKRLDRSGIPSCESVYESGSQEVSKEPFILDDRLAPSIVIKVCWHNSSRYQIKVVSRECILELTNERSLLIRDGDAPQVIKKSWPSTVQVTDERRHGFAKEQECDLSFFHPGI